MKTTKKLLSIAIVLALLVSTFAFALSIQSGAETIIETEPEEVSGTVYCQYKQYWYGKSEGWISVASNLADLKEYLFVDGEGLHLDIDEEVGMVSQQVYVNYSMDGTEMVPGTLALEQAIKGSGYLWFNVTVNAAKDKDGKEVVAGYKYHVTGKENDDNHVIPIPVGSTVTIKIDVSDISDYAAIAKTYVKHYFKNNDEWGDALSCLDVDVSRIYVMPNGDTPETQPTTQPTTTVPQYTGLVNDPDFPTYDADKLNVTIDDVKGKPGTLVEVPIRIKNNPGIFGGSFSIKYDPSILTASVANSGGVEIADIGISDIFSGDGEILSGPVRKTSDNLATISITFMANGLEDKTGDGVLATLRFTINDDVKLGTSTKLVFADYSVFTNLDEADVVATYREGTVTASSVYYGDVNDDGKIDSKDVLMLRKYLAKWTVTPNEENADVNADGKIDSKDVLLLRKFLAKWKVELGK